MTAQLSSRFQEKRIVMKLQMIKKWLSSTCKAVSLCEYIGRSFWENTEAVEEAELVNTDYVFIDFHAEVTLCEKQSLAWYLDGSIRRRWNTYACPNKRRPSSSTGDSLLFVMEWQVRITEFGMERDIIIEILNQLPARFEVAEDDEGQLSV